MPIAAASRDRKACCLLQGTVKLPVSELQAAHALLTLRPDQHVGSALDGRHMKRKQIARFVPDSWHNHYEDSMDCSPRV